MGFCMREDNGKGARSCSRGEGWVGGCARTTGWGRCWGWEGKDGSPHARGHGIGGGFVPRLRGGRVSTRGHGGGRWCLRGKAIRGGGGGKRGWVSACARTTGRGRILVGGGRDGFTRQYRMHRLVWYEVHESMESARAREKALKKWYRAWKVRLIEEGNPRWLDLYEGIV